MRQGSRKEQKTSIFHKGDAEDAFLYKVEKILFKMYKSFFSY